MFERFDPNTADQSDQLFVAAEPVLMAAPQGAEAHAERDEVDELPVMLRGLARIVKLMGHSVERWLNREHWEVGHETIMDMIRRGEEGLVLAFGPKWVGPHA